jgi:arylsulfatase A
MRVLLTLFFLSMTLALTAPAADTPPNVVIIFCDDMGYGDLSCFGAKSYVTPNLDSLAKTGTRFTNFHVAQAVCSASRAGLLTGCYPNRIGISGALGPKATHGISDSEMTIAQALKQKGYATAAVGKWHLGHHPQFLPTRHGFDQYFGLPYSNDMWPKHPESKFPDLPLIEGEKTIALNPDQTQLTTWYTEHAVKFIDANRDKPFFLYLAHSMPHVPLFVSDKFKGKTERGLFGDVIEEIDWSVGEVLAALKRNGMEENTLVIFTSDNGPWLSYGDHCGSTAGLREGKGTSWEGGVRVPCLMRWPGKIPAGRVSTDPLMTIDILPTLAHLAGAPLPAHPIDGMNIWPLLSGEANAVNPHDAYFVYYNQNDLQAVIGGKWKMVLPHAYRTLNGRPGGTGGIPVKYEMTKTALALYDMEADAFEQNDVASQHPDVIERLQKLAEKMRADLGDNLTGTKPTGAREPGRLAN